jgi:GTP cyclohydrolase I
MADSTPSKHFTNGGHDVSEDLTKAERDAIVQNALDSRSSDDITRAGQGETERQELINSILATNKRREVIEFSLPINGPSSPRMRRRSLHPSDERSARDPRDQAKMSASGSAPRPEGPYTKFPTVNFDGLSWPSK